MKDKIFKLTVIFCLLLSTRIWAQEGYFVDKDPRIAKFEKDIINFLIEKKQFANYKIGDEPDFYQNHIIVSKSLEIYSGMPKVKLLLIRFSNVSDHGDKYFGILTDEDKYFFYDTKSSQFNKFRKRYHILSTSTEKYFCDKLSLL